MDDFLAVKVNAINSASIIQKVCQALKEASVFKQKVRICRITVIYT